MTRVSTRNPRPLEGSRYCSTNKRPKTNAPETFKVSGAFLLPDKDHLLSIEACASGHLLTIPAIVASFVWLERLLPNSKVCASRKPRPKFAAIVLIRPTASAGIELR